MTWMTTRLRPYLVRAVVLLVLGAIALPAGATGVPTGEVGSAAFAFAPKGDALVIGLSGGTVTLWNWRTGARLQEFRNNTGITAVAWDPTGRVRAIGNAKGAVTITDARTGRAIRTIQAHRIGVTAMAFGRSGRWLATACEPDEGGGIDIWGNLRVWDVRTGKWLKDLDIEGWVTDLAVSPDGRLLASGGGEFEDGGHVRLWDTRTWTRTHDIEDYFVNSLSFSPDGKTLATGTEAVIDDEDRGCVHVWDVRSGRRTRTLMHEAVIVSVRYSPDGRFRSSADGNGLVHVTDARTGRVVRSIPNAGNEVRYSPDGKALACGGWGKQVRLYDAATGRLLRTLSP